MSERAKDRRGRDRRDRDRRFGHVSRSEKPQQEGIKRTRRVLGRGLFGLATTRRAAILAIVVCALALTIAVPLRTYLSQRDDLAVQEQRQAELRGEVQRLEERKAQLSDPAQVRAEARSRLRYVMPGEVPFLVELPGDRGTLDGAQPPPPPVAAQPWFQTLWNSIMGSGR
jgi:cell division protein FtsB